MLNCTVTYRSRDKKPGDNILKAFVSDGGVADTLNTLNTVIHDNDIMEEITTTDLNNPDNLFAITQSTVNDYKTIMDSYNAAFDELKRLGKYCRSPRERGLKQQINSAKLLWDNAEPSRRSRFRMRKV